MKKILLAVFSAGMFTVANAQIKDTLAIEKPKETKVKTDWKKIDLSNRANDHFMIQFGYDGWTNAPDSANPGGFSRHFNFYFMLDKPFKSNPRYSVGLGLGFASSNIFFKDTYIDIKSTTATTLPFKNVASADHFKRYKLTTTWVEAPLEFRYASNPVTPDKGWKAAIGFKFGLMLKAYTKGKDLLNSTGSSIYGKGYTLKEYDKKFFNTSRVAATARVGVGNFSIDGSYSLTGLVKSASGSTVNPYSIGLTISGL
ncbi:outer membrane beta-barrel protein [Panacibacter sp. DH6]|uniref:Outer membrane beta-barrel protein n=1 Tax=Panacibacter microcysteis TaxID=2793269 RepID=A0A931GUN7_9BACT|nr:outer membrane beta-barrel protein [Panacibacter microcysteis]MBG9375565.1 outer membrane beta-barrel protein [Panacibacter microcysteis]